MLQLEIVILHFLVDNFQKIIFYSRSRRTSDSGLENAAKTVVLFPGSGKANYHQK